MTSHFLSELISFLDGLPEPRIVMSADYRIIAANAAYTREFGGGRELAGRACYEVSHRFNVPCDQAGESCPLKLSLEAGEPQRVLHLHHTPRGEEHVLVETSPIRDETGEIAYFVETMRLVRQASSRAATSGLVGRSPAFSSMLEKMMRVAPSDAAVLLLGETGTGKELVAHAIHEASAREEGPFVAVDCAGMTETLFEAELFGYEKGAFTGATHRKQGLVEAASGGTLFLDEIGDMPLTMQTRLLRVLQERQVTPLGGGTPVKVNFALICATHCDLPAACASGRFRSDLYYRINGLSLHLPALRERSDFAALCDKLLAELFPDLPVDIAPGLHQRLAAYHWPGNLRQLASVLRTACAMLDPGDTRIDWQHLPDDILAALQAGTERPSPASAVLPAQDLATLSLAAIQQAIVDHQGNLSAAARQLGISRQTLYRKLKTGAGQ